MDYDAIQQVVRRLEGLYDHHQTTRQTLKTLLESLQNGGWTGQGAKKFFDEMNAEMLPSLVRLEGVFESVARSLLDVSGVMREAEEKAGNLFRSQGGGNISVLTDGKGIEGSAGKKDVSPSDSHLFKHTNGGEGWLFTNHSGFEEHEYVRQVGGSCVIYGAMNLLIQNGVDISQAEADAILADSAKEYGVSEAFPLKAAERVLDKYGVEYEHMHFDNTVFGINPFGIFGNDAEDAEEFLVDQISEGNSVYVVTMVDDSFGVGDGSAHAYTVVGVQQDSNGNATNVLVSTNWGGYQELPMDDFMKDWMEFNNAEYIIIKD